MKTKIHLGARTYAAPSEILNLEARENYTLIHFTNNSQLLSSTTLGLIEQRLKPFRFFRMNRSVIINLEHIDHFRVLSKPSKLDLINNSKPAVLLSRRRVAAFRACVNA